MAEVLDQIAQCVESGKVDMAAPYPPSMKGQEGVDELTATALADGISANDVLTQGLMVGMERIGERFSRNEVYLPDLLMAAKAMKAGMKHLKPFFDSGDAQHVGTVILGTVQGDLHDIGKNLAGMVLEGGGYEVIDLGADVPPEKFAEALDKHPGAVVGLSALLTTTMVNMKATVELVRKKAPDTLILVGGAPLNDDFANSIGASAYAPNPQFAVEYLAAQAN